MTQRLRDCPLNARCLTYDEPYDMRYALRPVTCL